MFFFMTGSELEVQRREAVVPGFGFHCILVENMMGPQIMFSLASLLDWRVRGLSEVSQLVHKGARIGTPLWTQCQRSSQPTTWLLFLSSSTHLLRPQFLPSPLSFHIPFLTAFEATFGMEKFSEFLGQVGCLVWLGDVLKALWVCSQDARSPGNTQGIRTLHWPFPWEPTHSPKAEGSRTPAMNRGRCPLSHSHSVIDMEGGPVCAEHPQHERGPGSPSRHPTFTTPAISLPWGAFQSRMDEPCSVLLGSRLQNQPDSAGPSSSAHAAQHCGGLSRGTHHGWILPSGNSWLYLFRWEQFSLPCTFNKFDLKAPPALLPKPIKARSRR